MTLKGGFTCNSSDEVTNIFTCFIKSPAEHIIFQIIFMCLTAVVVVFGVKNGIEKASKILMPFLHLV